MGAWHSRIQGDRKRNMRAPQELHADQWNSRQTSDQTPEYWLDGREAQNYAPPANNSHDPSSYDRITTAQCRSKHPFTRPFPCGQSPSSGRVLEFRPIGIFMNDGQAAKFRIPFEQLVFFCITFRRKKSTQKMIFNPTEIFSRYKRWAGKLNGEKNWREIKKNLGHKKRKKERWTKDLTCRRFLPDPPSTPPPPHIRSQYRQKSN